MSTKYIAKSNISSSYRPLRAEKWWQDDQAEGLDRLKEAYPHQVWVRTWSDIQLAELWCYDNVGTPAVAYDGEEVALDKDWTRWGGLFMFKDDRKASLFKLFWGD